MTGSLIQGSDTHSSDLDLVWISSDHDHNNICKTMSKCPGVQAKCVAGRDFNLIKVESDKTKIDLVVNSLDGMKGHFLLQDYIADCPGFCSIIKAIKIFFLENG